MPIDTPPAPRRPKIWLLALLPLALAGGGGYAWLSAGRYEETENAAVQQARISVAPELSGRVTEVLARDNTRVAAGDPLFRIDPEPYRLALDQAEAALAQARLGVAQLRAGWRVAQAQVKVAQDDAAYYAAEAARATSLTRSGASADAALDKARHAAEAAQQTLAAAQASAAAALAALGGNAALPPDDHPSVRAARVARDRAAWQLAQTTVTAPADGLVYQAASFKPGRFVGAGSGAFTLVETGDVWIEANFKETQLAGIAPGQDAQVEFDIRPGETFAAQVEAVGAGTGAEFSLLPAQNATGNWVKVTQRVPVRLRLAQDAPAWLRAGLSATVTVDTGHATHLQRLVGSLGAARAAAATPGGETAAETR